MAILGDLLFPPADYRRTTLSTIAWWERRRGPFNLIVGAAGVVTLVFVRLIALVPPGLPAMKPNLAMLAAVAAYGLMANVCYTVGWGVELMLRRILGKRAPAIGPALFRQGVAFSVGLTLLPILIVSIGWLARLGAWLFLR